MADKTSPIPTPKEFREIIDKVKKHLREHPRTEELPGLTEEAKGWRATPPPHGSY